MLAAGFHITVSTMLPCSPPTLHQFWWLSLPQHQSIYQARALGSWLQEQCALQPKLVWRKRDAPFHSRQMDCPNHKRCSWRQFLGNNTAVVLCTSGACCVLWCLQKTCCYGAQFAHLSHQHPGTCIRHQIKFLGSTHSTCSWPRKRVGSQNWQKAAQEVMHRMKNILLQKIAILKVRSFFGIS